MPSSTRLLAPALALCVLGLVMACAPVPIAAAPTPVSLKPANLLTPRPTLPPAATVSPTSTPVAEPEQVMAQAEAIPPTPPATPIPTLRGTSVLASEPLQGFLRDDRLYSPIIGESFAYRVYLPPDYLNSPQRRYPTLYMLHGNGGNYTEWTDSFLPEQIDRLIVAGDVQPIIVVMPDDGETTYWANWDNGPRWGDYVAEDVVTVIDERYRTLPFAGSRAIGGLSMGGLGALNLSFQHPDVFGVVGAHSPSIRLDPDPILWFLTDQNFLDHNPIWLAQNRTGLEGLRIWMDAGTEDIWLPNIEAAHEAFVGAGLNVEFHEFPGPHEAEYWIEHLPDYLRFYSGALSS